MGYHYSDYTDMPELIAMCINCTKEDCNGLCSDYRAKFRELIHNKTLGKNKVVIPIGRYKYLIEAFGKRQSLAEWSREYDIPYPTLYRRITYEGLSMEEALTVKKRNVCAPRLVCIDGCTLSITEWARKMGMDRQLIYLRIRQGMSCEDAIRMGNTT